MRAPPELIFAAFIDDLAAQSALRRSITEATRLPETVCLPRLIAEATLPDAIRQQAVETARTLVTRLRAKRKHGGVEGLVHEYSLSSEEGVALMCLAEALLRIPDIATRDALIRDKIGGGDWRAHLGHSPSLFVNAATWGLVVTGKLTERSHEGHLSSALLRLIARGGEPLIRRGVDLAMRMMGEQFVTGQTIAEALLRARTMEARGFRYSYDMLGEAAVTAADAGRYLRAYERAIDAIGTAAQGRGVVKGPGISIKLSALHPRYERAQRGRVMTELYPRLKALALRACDHNIGINIDAEEADRLELSLDLLERLCFERELAGWHGIGFVVQAYQKRAPFVLDLLIDLARRSGHRLMIRLVKGAYWDSEIKRAQVAGLADFPVYTRKIHTDVSYIACAAKLLAARDVVFAQFATHNALTLATIHAMAGPDFTPGDYEFQCLHGMGEPLYDEVVGPDKLARPCRIYAPVGTHETLLAYLVRRLLENGANSSFVNRIADAAVPVEALLENPLTQAAALQPPGLPHEHIRLPRALFGTERLNARGIDLSSEIDLAHLAAHLPRVAATGDGRAVLNPADHRDVVGFWQEASTADINHAFTRAEAAAAGWAATGPAARAACLDRAAELLEARMGALVGLIVREAGKSFANAVGEVREAVDFLRYYAAQIRARFTNATHLPLGPVICISPWNFPLAIFTGQIAAALAAGNPVLAKPAAETPLIAAEAVAMLHEAGIPCDVLHLLQGEGGTVGAALVADPRGRAVMFTGSTDVARRLQAELARRCNPDGRPVPLIAETGGQNAMVVDSSALAEQVVLDVLLSAFDSAGQRCSALRVLCLQEDIADHVLAMLKGAMAELSIGNPDRLSVDVGPVISAKAQRLINAHIATMLAAGRGVTQLKLPKSCTAGTFVPPTLIEINTISELRREVFGPVLHVLRFKRERLDQLIDAINATGYALTFGLHTRMDETVERVTARAAAGNVYVNRNIIGAVVGVQPFGGHGLSGTGPKAGGPLYLYRLLADYPQGDVSLAATELPGPVGEENRYFVEPRGSVLCVAATANGLQHQISAALATGNRALIDPSTPHSAIAALPADLTAQIVPDRAAASFDAVLFEGSPAAQSALCQDLATRPGAIVTVQTERTLYRPEWLLRERSLSINTTAAGGNASLMSIG